MAEEAEKAEASSASELAKGIAEEKAEASSPSEPAKGIAEEKAAVLATDESKALVVVEDAEKPAATGGSHDRDAFRNRVATEKTMSMIKAWEENEKARAENRAARRLASITSWENSKVAQMEAELKKIHEQLEMKKAARAEKLKNEAAAMRRAAEARRGEDVLRAGEAAARCRAREEAPTTTKLFGRG